MPQDEFEADPFIRCAAKILKRVMNVQSAEEFIQLVAQTIRAELGHSLLPMILDRNAPNN